ncbi:MAG: sodium-dependent transporter [Lachnospiraceae bacterium]|nr:sodium-dependent transporter [Lachnospiraceae bacterium]
MSENNKKREGFATRLGFILVSAGCAIGIGNVWKFPYLTGEYGGAAFILIYIIFLIMLGMPVMTAEFAIGRSSRISAALAFDKLEPAGTRWHHLKWISIIGCYMLMMFYTTVAGWMLYYCFKSLKGDFNGADTDSVVAQFSDMLGNTPVMAFWTVLTCIIGFAICYFGIKNGVERVSKVMMTMLIILMFVLAVHSVFLKGAGAGIRFYLVPDFHNMAQKGIGNVLYNALAQSFFTLSIGIGAMLIFGSYIDKDRSLTGEVISITSLDTIVALMAGFIIIPACFAYGIQPDAGPSLIFITIPNIFAKMPAGFIWNALFFLFLSFASITTVVAVFENIIAFHMDAFSWSRKKSVLVSAIAIIILSLPCVFGFNIWSSFEPFGKGSTVMDLLDFIVSNNLLPIGSLVFILFCTTKNGWGWDNYVNEADAGKGIKISRKLKNYYKFVIPAIVIVIYLKGYYDKFSPMGTTALAIWMAVALIFLAFIFFCALYRKKR